MRKFKLKQKEMTYRPNWREYQQSLTKPTPASRWRRRMFTAFLVGISIYSMVMCWRFFRPAGDALPPGRVETKLEEDLTITKRDVQILLQNLSMEDFSGRQILVPIKDQHLRIETSLEPDLQNHLMASMDRKHSRYIGIVVMQADTGRVLALAGFNKIDPEKNPCTQHVFPAASIFKIITAAAAVDHCGYNANTTTRFNGYKHTLYKKQLKENHNRYTTSLPFRDAFAQSINPIFGKLGTIKLGKRVLEAFATAFGFNQPIHFELPIASSQIRIKDKPYHWAEIASGFNNETVITPVHGAMIASAVMNDGRMVLPTIVDRIEDDSGRMLYQSQPSWRGRAMTAKASGVLTDLMETTIQSGTGRKTFRNYKRHRVLSKLRIGGKTGNISNRTHDARFDWFVGFAEDKKGSGRLVFAALVAHEEYIGTRATQYARIAMTRYFKGHLARQDDNKENSGG